MSTENTSSAVLTVEPETATAAPVTVPVSTPAGGTDGEVTLPTAIFGEPANIPLMHQVVVAQLAAARQGTHKAKNRGEVSGGGRKPYRQKGTGRARQGSTRAPQFNGGGTVHGPVPHLYTQRTPKKMKAAALRGALSDRARNGSIHVLSGLVSGEKPSTREAIGAVFALDGVAQAKHVLVVVARDDEAGWKSLRNAPTVHLIAADQLNTYDVLRSDRVVFTRAALAEFVAFAGGAALSVEALSVEAPAVEAPAVEAPAVEAPPAPSIPVEPAAALTSDDEGGPR